MEITASIDIHNELIAIASTNISNNLDVIDNLNIIIESANTIVDRACLLVTNTHTVLNNPYSLNRIVRDIGYDTNTSLLRHSDTIARDTSRIFRKATDILFNHKHHNINHNVNCNFNCNFNTQCALEIKSSADEVVTKSYRIINKTNNEIEANKKLQAGSLSS